MATLTWRTVTALLLAFAMVYLSAAGAPPLAVVLVMLVALFNAVLLFRDYKRMEEDP